MTKDIRKLLSDSKLPSVERSFLDSIKKLIDDGENKTVLRILENLEIPPLGSEFTNELASILMGAGQLTPAASFKNQA